MGIEQIYHIVALGPEVLLARMRYESASIGQVNDHVAFAMPTRCIPVKEEEPKD